MIDFVVIGGGIAGLSAGARLSEHGRVLLLETEDQLGYHASGRSAALYEPTYGNEAVRALNRASDGFLKGDGDGGYLSPRGLLLLAAQGDDAAFEAEIDGLGFAEITPSEAVAKVPILKPGHVARAAFHPDIRDIDTDRMQQDFARTIRANGGEMRTRAPVTAIARTAQGWDVTTARETVSARLIVNAAGPWADRLAQMAGIAPVGLAAFRRSMVRIAAPGGHDPSRWPLVCGTGEDWYAKPDAGQLIVSPAEEDPVDPIDAWPDDMVLAEGLARYQEFVTEDVTRPTATWAGLRTFAPDRALVLGPDPAEPSFIWAAGQGGYGFQTAPAASALVAALAVGGTPDLPARIVAALSPARFR